MSEDGGGGGGECFRCKSVIHPDESSVHYGKIPFHTDHFTCCKCDKIIHSEKFWVKENEFYCRQHYEDLFCPKCRGCGKLIDSGRLIKALGFHYHPACFQCTTCSKVLQTKYLAVNQKPFCEEHAPGALGPPPDSGGIAGAPPTTTTTPAESSDTHCAKCSTPIAAKDLVKAGGKFFHRKCLTCFHCHELLTKTKSRAFRKDDKLFCQKDYELIYASLCNACGKPILADCVFVQNDEYYHQDCFNCKTCSKKLEAYFSVAGELRCTDHTSASTTDTSCFVCNLSIPIDAVVPALGKKFHEACIVCTHCNVKVKKSEIRFYEDKLICFCCLKRKLAPPEDALLIGSPPSPLSLSAGSSKDLPTLSATPTPSDLSPSPLSLGIKDEKHDPASPRTAAPVHSPNALAVKSAKLLKHWVKGDLIGKGQFGKVYVALLPNGQWIAVKQLEFKTDEDSEHIKFVEQEVSLMEKLKHENIVQLLGMERAGPYINIFMEYVPGKSLDVHLKSFGAFPELTISTFC
jgi:hypothetical protein